MATTTEYITNNTWDAEVRHGSSQFVSGINLGYIGQVSDTDERSTYFYFPNSVSDLAGSVINSAYLSFFTHITTGGGGHVIIRFEDTGSPPLRTTYAGYTSATLTTANITINDVPGLSDYYTTPDISPIIQEIVNTHGNPTNWAAHIDNNLVGTGNIKTRLLYRDYDTGVPDVYIEAHLEINYTPATIGALPVAAIAHMM